jgi:hypothetical protein
MADAPRRFPAPWRAEPMPGGYIVRDANGQAIAYLYSRENEAEARQAKVLMNDVARWIAARPLTRNRGDRHAPHNIRRAQSIVCC